jgi:hypothetical protein
MKFYKRWCGCIFGKEENKYYGKSYKGVKWIKL